MADRVSHPRRRPEYAAVRSGTLKSRVNRARTAIANILEIEDGSEIGRPEWQALGDPGGPAMWKRN